MAIADVYDALTSARVYRGALCPFEVINMVVEQDGDKRFDPKYLHPFLEGVVKSFIGCEVVLSDGEKARLLQCMRMNWRDLPYVSVGKCWIYAKCPT